MKVIGIAGGTASGKTTLAREVHRQLEENGIASEVIGLDTFFIREMSVAKTVTSYFFARKIEVKPFPQPKSRMRAPFSKDWFCISSGMILKACGPIIFSLANSEV